MSSNNSGNPDDEFDFIESFPTKSENVQNRSDVSPESASSIQSSEKNKSGIKHLIQCHCMLPQYKNAPEPVFHQFMVFSILDEDSDTVEVKFASCNNCGAVHKIVDICKSEILTGRDEVPTQMSIEDFKFSLPADLYELLVTYNKEIADFEHAQFLLEHEKWNKHIILNREELDDCIQGKLVKFIASDRFRIESYIIKREVG